MNIEYLENWNPWWTLNHVPDVLKGIKRKINPLIFGFLKEREIIALNGIRRGGKTTVMYQMIDFIIKDIESYQILYVNLDDEVLKNESLENIYLTYKQNKNPDKKAYLFLDEIQNIEGWEKFLKKHYDMKDEVKFVISGSSSNLLRKEYSTLLTGRNVTFKIFPLSFKEYLDFLSIDYVSINTTKKNKILYSLKSFLEGGGFPEVFFKEKALKYILLKQYFDDIIYKDIVSRYNINAKKINDLALYLLTNISNLFTIRKIRSFTGLSIDSIKDYICYLEDAFLIKTLNYFSYSTKKSIQMPQKNYTFDCGLRNIAGFKFSKDEGKLSENLVFVELMRRDKDVYYWKGKNEVDFVIKNNDQSLIVINVSYSNEIDEREIKGLIEFEKKFKKTKELILITKDFEKEDKHISYIPLWKWLLK